MATLLVSQLSESAPRFIFTGSKTLRTTCDKDETFYQKQPQVLIVQIVLKPKDMGKNKDKKTSKTVISDVFVEMNATLLEDKNTQKHALLGDTDSCKPETGGLKKPNKKRKKRDLHDQEENQASELKIENHEGNRKLKKRKTLRDEKVTHLEEVHSCEASPVRTAQDQPSPQKESSRKKKKREKLQQSENNIKHEESEKHDVGSSRKKKKKSSREELTMELEEKANIEEPVKKKKKKKKTKQKKKEKKDCSVWAEPVSEVESDAPVAQEIQNNINLKIEPADDFDEKPAGPLKQASKNRRKDLIGIDTHLLEELKEFVPDVEFKERMKVQNMIKYDLPRFREFKKKGISIKHGRFTVKENARLRKNVEDFMALTGIDSATKLFFLHRFKEERESIKKLQRKHRFLEYITAGIARSYYHIYTRGRRLLDASNYMGIFSNEEVQSLVKWQTIHGNNWKIISELTGRSADSLIKRFKHICLKKGPWSKKDVQRLLRAVRDHVVSQHQADANNKTPKCVSKTTLYKGLPWSKIAEKVKIYSWSKCRYKWMSILAVRMSSESVCTKKKSKEIKVKLIKAMYEMEVDDVALVNWEDLTDVIGNVPPDFVQRKWHKLKVCYVPHWQSKSFADTIDFLYEKVLPKLEEELKEYADVNEDEMENQQETYFLSDIFQDIDEDYDVDDDDDDDDNSGI